MNAVVTKDMMLDLQAEVLKIPQYEFPTKHYFADGMYAREIFIPETAVIVGAVHIKEHFAMLLKGRMSIVQTGKPRMILSAGDFFVSQPGAKRAGFAFEDSVFMTIHRTSLTDIAEIEKEIAETDPQSAYLPGNKLKHGALK